MKSHRILAILLAAFFVTLPNTVAQKPNNSNKKPVSHAAAHLATLSAKLHLTPEQQARIKPVLDDESSKIVAIKMDKTLSAGSRKAKIEPVRDDADKQIRGDLTPAQQKIYDAMSKKAESGGTKKPGGKKAAKSAA